ncbi:MAG TPA: hypothetical protein VKZ59_12875, partial [Acidobacteriota bacterium]|nr:hypothetical protein [Acidobacteriota bacterium]
LITEMNELYAWVVSFLQLQWGRDRLITEMCQRELVATLQKRLQWGRDRLITEMAGFPSH